MRKERERMPAVDLKAALASSRRSFSKGEWWYCKVDIYKSAKPLNRYPRKSCQHLIKKMKTEGIEVPTAYLPLRAHDGQIENYACTTEDGAEKMLKRLSGCMYGEPNFPDWKAKVEAAAAKGKIRVKVVDGVRYFAGADMIPVIRSYYMHPESGSSTYHYLAKKEGLSPSFYPWSAKLHYVRDRGEREASSWSVCIAENHLPEFFHSLWHIREIPHGGPVHKKVGR